VIAAEAAGGPLRRTMLQVAFASFALATRRLTAGHCLRKLEALSEIGVDEVSVAYNNGL
jgi:hypothetical protein